MLKVNIESLSKKELKELLHKRLNREIQCVTKNLNALIIYNQEEKDREFLLIDNYTKLRDLLEKEVISFEKGSVVGMEDYAALQAQVFKENIQLLDLINDK